MAETISENYEKLTDENMLEYTKFSTALHHYLHFLLKVRKVSMQQAVQVITPMVRETIIGVNALKE